MTVLKDKLTNSILKDVDPFITRINDTETTGFHARISKPLKDGRRKVSFYVYFRFKDKQFNHKIGTLDVLSCSDARKEALAILASVAKGTYVSKSEKTKQRRIKESNTLNKLIDEFVSLKVMRERRRPEVALAILNKDVRPTIGELSLDDIDTSVVSTKCLDPILLRGSNVQANRTLTILKQMYQWALEKGKVKYNPVANTRRKSVGGEESERERFLTVDEIEYFFNWLNSSTASINVKHCLYILLHTGCRVGEVVQAEWSHIDFEKRNWHFPADNRKGAKGKNRDHNIYLTDAVIKHLEALRSSQMCLDTNYVFANASSKSHLNNTALAKYLKRRFDNKELDMESFTPHDLRRTFTTHLRRLRVDYVVVEKCLSHKLPKIQKTYDQHDYTEEKKEAWQLWETELSKII